MRKKTSSKKPNKKTVVAKQTDSKNITAVAVETKNKKSNSSYWSWSVYVYWLIILFFIAATFYILGRSHSILRESMPSANKVEITEEKLLQPADYYEKGKKKLLTGDIEGAITELDVAIKSNPKDVDSLILRGEANMQSANYTAALADFDAAIKDDPVNAVAYYDRALLHVRLEDYPAAIDDINNALAAQSKKPTQTLQMRDLYAKRGQLNLWVKNWEGAVADYTNSLARPEGTINPDVYAERAEALTALGKYEPAISDYLTAVRVISEQIQGATTPEEREYLSSRAMSYFEKSAALNLKLGNIDSAQSNLEAAFAIAAALNDTESINRLQNLINSLPNK